jgi:tRNA(Arg) A34 adenosine deaminase TadA
VLPVELRLLLPNWVPDLLAAAGGPWPTDDEQMGLVLDLARGNVHHRSGGPFAAAVFGAEGQLVAVGVNLVEPGRAAIAHAEIVAIALAGQATGTFDLGAGGPTTLVASTEPCAMCLGAVPWSGVTRLVCGADDADARAIGFEEGHKPDGWVPELEARGITVALGVRRAEAAEVLQTYVRTGGTIYNGASSGGGAEPGDR